MKALRSRRPKLDEMFSVPVDADLKKQVVEIATSEERRPADMVRVLLKEAIASRAAKIESETVASK